jgi:hypothetical protein
MIELGPRINAYVKASSLIIGIQQSAFSIQPRNSLHAQNDVVATRVLAG